MTAAPAAAPPAPALWLTPDGRTLGSLLGLRVGPGSSPSSCSWSLGVLEVTATQDLEAAAKSVSSKIRRVELREREAVQA